MTKRLRQTVRYHRDHTPRAFTLIEMLLSLTITAMLVVSVVSATSALTDARRHVDGRIERLTEARHAVSTIVAELRNVRRDGDRRRPVIIGEAGADDANNDTINLLVIGDRRSRDEGAESDQYEVGFSLVKLSDRRFPALMRRRDHALDEHIDQGGILTVVAEGIVVLDFEYYTGTDWEPEWPRERAGTPQAVRVTVAAVDTNPDAVGSIDTPETVTFSTVVPIHAMPWTGNAETDRSRDTDSERAER